MLSCLPRKAINKRLDSCCKQLSVGKTFQPSRQVALFVITSIKGYFEVIVSVSISWRISHSQCYFLEQSSISIPEKETLVWVVCIDWEKCQLWTRFSSSVWLSCFFRPFAAWQAAWQQEEQEPVSGRRELWWNTTQEVNSESSGLHLYEALGRQRLMFPFRETKPAFLLPLSLKNSQSRRFHI